MAFETIGGGSRSGGVRAFWATFIAPGTGLFQGCWEYRSRLEEACKVVKGLGGSWTWVAPERWHWTWQFYARLSPETLKRWQQEETALWQTRWEGQIRLGSLGVFKLHTHGVVFVSVEGLWDGMPLRQWRERWAHVWGLSAQDSFIPHVTLARFYGHPGSGKFLEKLLRELRGPTRMWGIPVVGPWF